MEILQIPGVRRIGSAEWLEGERPEPGEPYWVDHVLYDIIETVRMAVINGARNGAKAVTLYTPLTILSRYRCVIDACRENELVIVTADTPDFTRRIWWSPQWLIDHGRGDTFVSPHTRSGVA